MKATWRAIRRHKYKYPMETINYIQSLFDALKDYKNKRALREAHGESSSDNECFLGMIFSRALKKDAYFIHNQDYIYASMKIEAKWENPNFLLDLDSTMKNALSPIKCVKYNYAVDKNVQNFDS